MRGVLLFNFSPLCYCNGQLVLFRGDLYIAVPLIKAEIILPCTRERGLVFSVRKILSKGVVSRHLVQIIS